MAGTGLLLQNECCVPKRPAATVTTLNWFKLNWCRCLILMKNEVSFLLKSSKCGSSIRRIYTDGKADSCECISGSFAENEAGDCNVVAGQSTKRVSGSLCYCPAYLCVKRTNLIALSCFFFPPTLHLLTAASLAVGYAKSHLKNSLLSSVLCKKEVCSYRLSAWRNYAAVGIEPGNNYCRGIWRAGLIVCSPVRSVKPGY